MPGKLVPPGAVPIVRLQAIEKYFGANHVLRGCNLDGLPERDDLHHRPVGSGKSTLLRCTNFLEEPTVGRSRSTACASRPIRCTSRSRAHREQIRQIRMRAQMVFQEFNLFPHMTRHRQPHRGADARPGDPPKDEAIATAEKYLDKVGLYARSAMSIRPACRAARSSASRSPGR